MAVNSSEDFKNYAAKLSEASTLQKEVETLKIWTGQLSNNEAVVQNIQVVNATKNTSLFIDEDKFKVNLVSREFVTNLINQRINELEAKIQAISQEIDSKLP